MLEEFTVLYVEDNKDMQMYMDELLKDEVKELYQAYNGIEGLSIFEEKRPDIIITDVSMPILNGLEMCKKIKQIEQDQIIILLSSLSDINVIKESIDLNIDGYINKPILDIDDFLEKIYSKVSLLQYKQVKRKEEKMEALLDVIQEISHHWRQPLNIISLISSEYAFKYENNIPIQTADLKNFEVITNTVSQLSNVLEQIEKITMKEKDIDNLLAMIRIGNPIYKN